MKKDDKKVYLNMKREKDNWFFRGQKVRKVTALSMFVQKQITDAKHKHKPTPQIKELVPAWHDPDEEEKEKYQQYADEINEERRSLQDLFDFTHGFKPKRPAGVYRVFLQEKAKFGELTSLKQGKELLDRLKQEEKEFYLVKDKRAQLAYKYKKLIYEKK